MAEIHDASWPLVSRIDYLEMDPLGAPVGVQALFPLMALFNAVSLMSQNPDPTNPRSGYENPEYSLRVL